MESDRYSDPLQTSNTEPLIALVSLQKTPTMDHGDSRGWGVGVGGDHGGGAVREGPLPLFYDDI